MATLELRTSQEVAALLGMKPGRIAMALYDGRLKPPQKYGRAYLWSKEDILRACRCFNVRWLRPEGPAGMRGLQSLSDFMASTDAAAAAPSETAPATAKE